MPRAGFFVGFPPPLGISRSNRGLSKVARKQSGVGLVGFQAWDSVGSALPESLAGMSRQPTHGAVLREPTLQPGQEALGFLPPVSHSHCTCAVLASYMCSHIYTERIYVCVCARACV